MGLSFERKPTTLKWKQQPLNSQHVETTTELLGNNQLRRSVRCQSRIERVGDHEAVMET